MVSVYVENQSASYIIARFTIFMVLVMRRLSSQEFVKLFDAMWEQGPKVNYKDPDKWRGNWPVFARKAS